MKKLQYMLLVAGLWMVGTMCVMAQVPSTNIRYVKTEANGGKYTNDGRSWTNAKNNIQDAINDLIALKALPGEVWVGAGTYRPTESTESSGGSTMYMSFKIPAGITVRGGFPADGQIAGADITSPDQRRMLHYTEVGDFAQDQTILTGDLSTPATFVWNSQKNQFTTTFYGNSYHVVTFATNGFHPDGHAKALDTSKGEAAIDGMIIEHGNAHFTATEGHPHEAYGGGIYMVKGSHVYNTCVRECEATRNGGGIYMDGGGMADHVYVSECQALGIGTTYGYGGGICMEDGTYDPSDPTKGMYPAVLRRSGVTGSVARNGGGMAVYCNNTAYKNRLACSAVLIANNVAQNEAGGVYLYQGGAISQMTIVRNKCYGSGISVNGMVNGRSGGIYVRDFGNIANSVIWGNECGNRNVQYSGSRSGNEEAKKPVARCVMLSNSDYADWSGVVKYRVNDLDTDNTGTKAHRYPGFKNPTPTAGYISDIYQRSLMPIGSDSAYSWKVNYASALTNAGIQTIDLDTAGVTPALNESRDIMGQVFSSYPTLGGYTSTAPVAKPWDNTTVDGTMHLFVDPSANYADDADNIGNSWNNAAHSLSDIFNLLQRTLDAFGGSLQPSTFGLTKLQVHVKEGAIVHNGTYTTGRVRNHTMRIPVISSAITDPLTIEILGGYPSSLTGRDVSVRNPMKYPTVITGEILDDYAYNTAHLVTFDGAKDVTFDGFQLRNGNATSTLQENANQNGAAFTFLNAQNIKIKNCLVAGCSAEIGAAVYAVNSVVDFENCIFHNNAATQQIGLQANKPGVIYSGGTGTLTFDHCDVLRNVGYGAWNDGTGSLQQWTNSIFYGNLNQSVDDTNDNVDNGPHYIMALPAFGGTVAGQVTGSYCLFDGKSRTLLEPIFTVGSRFDMSYRFDGGANSNYPRYINPTKNAGVSPSGDITYYGRATSFEPHNTNPMVNAASTKDAGGTEIPHPAGVSSDCWGKDMSTVVNRDYGGLPDIGAVENHVANKATEGENAYADGQGFYGRTLYVRDYGNLTKGGDGSSWANAINGNAYYHEASGRFLGATRNQTISWTETVDSYSTTYGPAGTISTDSASTLQNPKLFVISNPTITKTAKYVKIIVSGANTTINLVEKADATQFVISSTGELCDYNAMMYLTTKSNTAFTTSGASKQWTISGGKIYHLGTDGKLYYWRVGSKTATSAVLNATNSNNVWQIERVIKTKTGTTTTPHDSVDVVGINGLQYAVNKAAIWREQDKIRREVWVGAGVYSKDNETAKTGYFEIDEHPTIFEGKTMSGAIESNVDESCFVIRDGVDVYGAFPKVGNPGKEQRQALVSQYVSVSGYTPADYETILQPATPLTTESMANTRRVLGQPFKCQPTMGANTYSGAVWDGFTLRNGYLDSRRVTNAKRIGAAGAAIYVNVTLRNCVVTRCVNYAPGGTAANGEFRAGGVFVRGGSVEQCYIINNEMRSTSNTGSLNRNKSNTAYGGGLYIYDGTVYNCVVANNFLSANNADGAGVFIDGVVRFFNNTVVNNKADGSTRYVGGLCGWMDDGVQSSIVLYNNIICNNVGYKAFNRSSAPLMTGQGNENVAFQNGGKLDVYNCIVKDSTSKNYNANNYVHYHNCQTITDADFTNYLFTTNPGSFTTINVDMTGGADSMNLRLKANSPAINMGEVNPDINGEIYNLEEYTDMDYTERVKDCSIDIGAYEYNDAYAISPDVTTESGKAIYYVTPYGRGVASAANPENAACAEKLQKVLDAAGRYKYLHPGMPVIVKVACEASGSVDPDAAYHTPTWSAIPEMRIVGEDTTYVDAAWEEFNNNPTRYLTALSITPANGASKTYSGLTRPSNSTETYRIMSGEAPTFTAGDSLTFTLTFTGNQTSQPLVASVWVDMTGKKTFTSQLIQYGTFGASDNDLSTFKVAIPKTALNGVSRLRLRLDKSSAIGANADAGYRGMVYDIPITINGGAGTNAFKYYATRSTDPANQDVRIWSIMVPRGVEVWGGYTDAYTSPTEHGFRTRDVVANPTHFDATYTNKGEHTTATTYHTVTFTDRIFDGNGNPYMAGDNDLNHDSHYVIGASYDHETDFKHMSDNPAVTDRAVLDGIFLTGGKADAPVSASAVGQDQAHTIHQYGGAAVVEPYAHVRNCIVENNHATFGGALALKEKALVSGCLIRNNTATSGAGIYVFENGTKLVESARFGIYTVNTDKGSDPAAKMDENMSRVILSTIVRNEAESQGGGLWFTNSDANVRVNSSVLWRNDATDQPNVSGAYSPEKPDGDPTSTVEFYPFAYSAVQNIRLSGTNNQMLQPANKNGARFSQNGDIEHMATDESNFSDFGYYGLTTLSAMVRTGMSLSEFDHMRSTYSLAAADFMAVDRKVNDPSAPARTYVEIGARALNKPYKNAQLMLRLFVAQPEDVDADAAMAMALLSKEEVALPAGLSDAKKDSLAAYYSQQGSSFAYPFQSLQDALDYIYMMRSTKIGESGNSYIDTYHANNLPFEIFLAKGTYYPTRDLSGNYGESLANTFAIPEGVSLFGGFSVNAGTSRWYGRYVKEKKTIPTYNSGEHHYGNEYDISQFVDTLGVDSVLFRVDARPYTLLQKSAVDMQQQRRQIDVNKNNVVEPWEFENQTILSGNSTNATGEGVYHIVTVCPDEKVVGILPNPQYVVDSYDPESGYIPQSYAQYVHFNGITFQGGRAHSYSSELDSLAKFNYYHGGAVLLDGNRYNDSYNTNEASRYADVAAYNAAKNTTLTEDQWLALQKTQYMHTGHTNAVGYRDAPVSFASCRFYDNEAGYGGAISANMEFEVYQSSFEHNMASFFSDQVTKGGGKINVTYAGQGGAIFSTYHVTAYNTLFANNEARDLTHTDMTSGRYYSYRNHDSGGSLELPGTGGAIYSGVKGFMHIFNCNLVRNMANSYPAIFTMNPNYYKAEWNTPGGTVSSQDYNQITNTVLWGNELNPVTKSNPANASKLFAAQMVVNYGPANRDGAAYDLAGNIPANQAALDDAANDGNLTAKRYTETMHFCAYEPGRGMTPKNDNDFRAATVEYDHHTLFQYSHIADTITAATYFPYQNSNIVVVSDNDALDGPAFMRPSTKAGIDGYLESADWSPSRLNNLTDHGNSHLQQSINPSTKEASFVKVDGKFVGTGSYVLSRYYAMLPNYSHNLPLGDERYMHLDQTDDEMYRISLDPNPTHNQSYIDIGVYEYIHVPLKPETADEVDILWVSNIEKPENGLPDGSRWEQPTSDLQRAIETLLASRNGHRKEVRLCDGTYTPIYTIKGSLSFYIDTKYLNVAATGGGGDGTTTGLGVKSLTIKGGYSREYNGVYDVNLYPAIIKQQETAAPSEKYDHLIFINDATQRYHGSYSESNGYGWTNGVSHSGVHTIPIQIDGVTIINDQASDRAAGSAIYYRGQTFGNDYEPVDVTPTYTASSTTDASITTGINGSGHHTYEDKTNPYKLIITKTTVLGSGSKNPMLGSSAVYVCPGGGNTLIYNSLFHSNTVDPLFASNALLINNTFALNGGQVSLFNYTTSEPSKDITSKMFNNVLWRNNPTGPSTYGYQLEMDGLAHGSGTDYNHTGATAGIFARNAYTGGNTVDIDYDPTSGTTIRGNNYNVGLVDLNTDVTYGPNFHDPHNSDILKRDFRISPSMRLLNKGDNDLYGDTALNRNTQVYDLAWEVTKRYDITSSKRIAAGTIDLGAYEYQYELNRVLYVDPNKATSGDGLSWEKALGFGNIQNAIDLAGVSHTNLNKSTFVFVKAASSTNMDLHTGETLTLRDGVQVYGSVRSDYGVECPYRKVGATEERIFNDDVLEAYVGDVLLYGRYGIISPVEGHTRIAGINTNGTAFTTIDKEHQMTIIDGFEVMPKDAAAANITSAVVHINPYKADETPAEDSVQVGLRNIAVHGYNATGCDVAYIDNAILYSTLFHHNTVSGGNAVMRLGANGYLLNATIEGKTVGADNSSLLHGGAEYRNDSAWANTAKEADSHVFCSLVNFNGDGVTKDLPTIQTLSGYCYALEDENLNYQLTEYSPNIDNYRSVVPEAIPTHLRGYASALTPEYDAIEAKRINDTIDNSFNHGLIGSSKLTVYNGKLRAADRDLLGNFRWQPGFKYNPACPTCNNNGLTYNIIDRGAFETWKIDTAYFVEYPNYPYPGSCEYVMAGQALMIDPVADDGDATAAAHIPGFVLLQEGASLYGNGREMEIAYVGIERTIKNGADVMLSLPWDQNMIYNGISDATRNAVNGVFVVEYDANGVLNTVRTDASPVYTYDPSKRADWQYRMKPSESECWTPITSPILPACTGVYTNVEASNAAAVKGGNAEAELTMRCMGKGASMHDYIYEELVEPGHIAHTGKSVKLYPNDDITPTNGGGDFTDAKNAGWNFIGYPYLISLYHPYTKAIITAKDSVFAELNPGVYNQDKDNVLIKETYDQFLASSNPYAMNRPQTMWIWYDGVNGPDRKPVDGTGGFYSVNSWLKEPSAWHVDSLDANNNPVQPVLRVTEGFFVQTHTLQESEDLVFYRPTYRSHYGRGRAHAPAYSPYRYYVGDGSEKEDGGQPGVVSPEQVDSMMQGYEKLIRDQHVYIVRRDASGRISEAYDLTGRAVKL